MKSKIDVQTECRMIGDFIDDAMVDAEERKALQERWRAAPGSELVLCRLIGSFVDESPCNSPGPISTPPPVGGETPRAADAPP
jgi:hypothetical protein